MTLDFRSAFFFWVFRSVDFLLSRFTPASCPCLITKHSHNQYLPLAVAQNMPLFGNFGGSNVGAPGNFAPVAGGQMGGQANNAGTNAMSLANQQHQQYMFFQRQLAAAAMQAAATVAAMQSGGGGGGQNMASAPTVASPVNIAPTTPNSEPVTVSAGNTSSEFSNNSSKRGRRRYGFPCCSCHFVICRSRTRDPGCGGPSSFFLSFFFFFLSLFLVSPRSSRVHRATSFGHVWERQQWQREHRSRRRVSARGWLRSPSVCPPRLHVYAAERDGAAPAQVAVAAPKVAQGSPQAL